MGLTGELNPAVTFYTTLNSPVLTGETNGQFNPFDFNQIKTELDNAKISEVKDKTFESLDARFEETENDVKALVADVDVALSETNLRIAEINKEVTDYKNTIAGINANQSPKQTASGYGTVSLPVNAANGQISNVQIKGLTATNMVKNGDFSNGTTGWIAVLATHTAQNGKLLTTVTAEQGNSAQDNLALTQDHKYYISALVKSDSDLVDLRLAVAVSPWTTYGVAAHDGSGAEKRLSAVCPVNLTTPRGVIRVRDNRTAGWTTITSANYMCIDLTATFGSGNEPTKEVCDKIFANWFNGTNSTVSAMRLKSVGKNLFDKKVTTGKYLIEKGEQVIASDWNYTEYIKVESNKSYIASGYGNSGTNPSVVFYDSNHNYISGRKHNRVNPFTFTTPNNCAYIKDSIHLSGIDTYQLEQGTTTTPYEPYTYTTQYYPDCGLLRSGGLFNLADNGEDYENWMVDAGISKSAEGLSTSIDGYAELPANFKPSTVYTLVYNASIPAGCYIVVQSNLLEAEKPLQNGFDKIKITTKSSITDSNLRLLFYIVGSSRTITFALYGVYEGDQTSNPDVDEPRPYGGSIVYDEIAYNKQSGQYEKIQRIDDDGEPLPEPVISSISVAGTLIGHPNGMVYWEPVLPVAGVYTAEGISVTDTDFPIDTLERIAKIDFMTGVETEVDVSQAVIAGDGLSFTHPDLIDGDIVFFTYFHGIEGTQPKIDVEYYDSRYTVKDTVIANKFYQWTVTVANGVPSLVLEEV